RGGPGRRREAGPAGEESRLVFYSDTTRWTRRSHLRDATARHADEVVGRQPEHGLRVARGGPDLVALEEVLVDQRRQGPGGANGRDAPDRESRSGAHERGVRLLDRLVDEPGELVLVHALRAAPREPARRAGAPSAYADPLAGAGGRERSPALVSTAETSLNWLA